MSVTLSSTENDTTDTNSVVELNLFKTTGGIKQNRKRRETWTDEERSKFEEAFNKYGRDYAKISAFIGSKTIYQVRSHAQKFFKKKGMTLKMAGERTNHPFVNVSNEEYNQKKNEVINKINHILSQTYSQYEFTKQIEMNSYINTLQRCFGQNKNHSFLVVSKSNASRTKQPPSKEKTSLNPFFNQALI
ncbi:Myb family DNA-binding protein, SHAQKYF family [Entamoeba histolytica HM-1:IMSS]|uniref:Myb family DNA-binding protein, SHAQKYF family n=4 Tax=Entamoeba histolytica TaxID=5759 RepID=C4MB69_ENTH1|nr:Myb family DNA-binding protein, SHAQKYF family [Entamoeba histolytica HM-1:IMSS]EAL42795.1 Myb family DNA-binding protein, SHAQKYF family [Entamoeba histolytica HM-1:IMSS]EMD44073.1 Myb family DNAbinding protein shaqkyf family protein [Entamoeba histolytica KU27]|eukprot:XP_648179.1 Myb family DNA-binding protein, SHAQKYF family [Entamoeba histolytica HM-1:IMSS]